MARDRNALDAYLLGTVPLARALAWQRRLVYDITGDRRRGALVLCEHLPAITVGRSGSADHVAIPPVELHVRGWPVQWLNRGGGVLLHTPGQLAIYSVVALDRLGLTVGAYLDRVHSVLAAVVTALHVPAERRPGRAGLWVRDRQIAHVGVAVRDWVTYFGAALNVAPDLEHFRRVRCDGEPRPMTSLERESRTPVRPAAVRQQLVESFADAFAFDGLTVLHHEPYPSVLTAETARTYRYA